MSAVSGAAGAAAGRLAPVDERCLAFDKTVGRGNCQSIVIDRFLDYRIDVFEPFAVAGHFIKLIGGHGPYHAVGAHRPCTSAAGILYYDAFRVHLFHQRDFRCLGLRVGHGEKYRVADIAGPYSAPFLAGAQGSVGFDGVDHLVEPHVVNGGMECIGSLELRICRNVVFQFPFFFNRETVTWLCGVG